MRKKSELVLLLFQVQKCHFLVVLKMSEFVVFFLNFNSLCSRCWSWSRCCCWSWFVLLSHALVLLSTLISIDDDDTMLSMIMESDSVIVVIAPPPCPPPPPWWPPLWWPLRLPAEGEWPLRFLWPTEGEWRWWWLPWMTSLWWWLCCWGLCPWLLWWSDTVVELVSTGFGLRLLDIGLRSAGLT